VSPGGSRRGSGGLRAPEGRVEASGGPGSGDGLVPEGVAHLEEGIFGVEIENQNLFFLRLSQLIVPT
jgi:hypothetical protein